MLGERNLGHGFCGLLISISLWGLEGIGHVEGMLGARFAGCRLSQGRRETENLRLVSTVSCLWAWLQLPIQSFTASDQHLQHKVVEKILQFGPFQSHIESWE